MPKAIADKDGYYHDTYIHRGETFDITEDDEKLAQANFDAKKPTWIKLPKNVEKSTAPASAAAADQPMSGMAVTPVRDDVPPVTFKDPGVEDLDEEEPHHTERGKPAKKR